MAPTPEKSPSLEEKSFESTSGQRVVISGMAGLYPESHSVKDLSDILYNKINPINRENPRWKCEHTSVSQFTGKVPEVKLFDANFFKVHYKLSQNMEPMARKLLEKSFEAIYDAGVCPDELSGKNVAVFIGNGNSEMEKATFDDVNLLKAGVGLVGCCRAMYANRISYYLNIKGPSLSIDESCSSSTRALEQGYLAIKRGECEAAIVGGSSLCLLPHSVAHYGRILKMSTDGKTKSFDNEAAGCANSEAINILFLQKAENALRIYADVVHVKSGFISIPYEKNVLKFGFYRDPETMANFISNFYAEAKVSPEVVEYVEAFGAADPHADKAELEAIEKVYCKNRSEPLLVGSVMSNIGYTESASGIAAITKVLLGYQYGRLAANMHCHSPRKDIDSLCDGRMRIVTDHEHFGRTYAAVNNMSLTGVNCHALLYGHNKPKDTLRYKTNFPQLVTISGRQESSVNRIFTDLKSRPVDPEELALLRNIHKSKISGNLGRGFILLDSNENNETICLREKIYHFDEAKRPLWFVYSGMGSQWPGMGTQLMKIPVFAAAIERCRRVLEPKGVDIVHIITSPDKTILDNILHCFVGIAAIQIGLTDVLREIKIYPDMIIGHSVGELGCAYADGCFTAEEMILSAYSRGLVSVQTHFSRGSMAAVGIGYQEISKMCLPEIEVACHNGPNSSTISGPADNVKQFVAQLTAKGIFAKEVPCSNIAYHSRYIASAGPSLLKYLREVIKSPKARSERWVSTSVPQDKWNDPIAKYSSAEYHTNNLLNPVLFEETSRLIPKNAVVVEIAPHGLLQAILKRSLPQSCKHVPLTRREHSDNAIYLLEAIGNLFTEGFNPHVQELYPKVAYPVSTGTPMLSHLIEWAHNEEWNLVRYTGGTGISSAQCTHVISIHDDEHCYLKGHVIRENNTYPFAATLVGVWDTLAMVLGLPKKQFSVHFSDVHLHSQPVLHDQRLLRLNIAIHRGTGRFEVLDDGIKVATGFVISELKKEKILSKTEIKSEEVMELNSNDIYQFMISRDYNYSYEFRSIYNANALLTKAHILWQDNWVTLIDGMIQLNALKLFHENVSQPTFIKSIGIDVKKHLNNKKLIQNNIVLPAIVFNLNSITRCGGVSIENLKFCDLPSTNKEQIAIRTLKFIPHYTTNSIDKLSAICVFLQILADNLNKRIINIVEVMGPKGQTYLKDNQEIIHNLPEIEINLLQKSRDNFTKETVVMEDFDVLMTNNLAVDDNMYQALQRILNQDIFLINKEEGTELSTIRSPLYHSVCAHTIGSHRLELNIWQPSNVKAGTSIVTVFSQADLGKVSSQLSMLPQNHRLVILSYPAFGELKDLVKKWRNEYNRKINLVIINDKNFDEHYSLNQMQFTDLSINIVENGILGGEYYLPIQGNATGNDRMALEITRLGDMESLRWIEKEESNYPGISVKVHYAGLNNIYTKQVLGLSPREYEDKKKLVHYDFSGTTNRNVRVMGIVQDESINVGAKVKPELLWPVPEHWSLEDAATVPLAYSLAFYCLCFKSRLYPGNSILVHGGAGALGQAIISIALAHECDIFTTVSDIKKKQFLLRLFPELKEDHIGCSRDDSFIDMTSRGTNGKGCDIVITSAKEELRNASIRCCKLSGFIVDVSLILDNEDYDFGMFHLAKPITYSTLQFSTLFEDKNLENLKRLQLMVSEGIARGYVRPLSRVVYQAEDASRALRYQAGGWHLGRVLLHLEGDISYTQETISCSSEKLHLLFLENDILGVQFANRLINRGARKLILHCSNKSNIYLFKKSSWEKQGVQCSISYGNMWDENFLNLLNEKIRENIEGIYFFLNANTKNEKMYKYLERFTYYIRRSNMPIKYFAAIDTRKEMSDEIKSIKAHDQLKTIALPSLKIFENVENKEYISISCAVDVIEKALSCKQLVVAAHVTHTPVCNLLQQVISLAGVTIPNGTSQDVTLKELGMDASKSQIVLAYLRKFHYILPKESSIPLLTIGNIRKLEERTLKKKLTETEDLKTFFSHNELDELLAITEIVFLPTLTTSITSQDHGIKENRTNLCIVPGVEGLHVRFLEFCERLKLPALVFQPGLDKPNETIQEMAQRYTKNLINKTKSNKRFYLVGYESGVLVALEMAAILEDHGLTGKIFCIGGEPDDILAIFEAKLAKFKTEHSLQVAVATHMFNLMNNGDNIEDLENDLKNISTWKEKVSLCVQKLLGRIDHSIDYAKELIEAAYARIVQVRRYKSEPRVLRSLLISIRTLSSGSHHVKPLSLQKHSQQVVEYEIQVPLAYAAQDLRCAAIVNRHLDIDILEEFDKSNLCETYFTNIDLFSNK